MKLLAPWSLIFIIFIPFVILMYILKQRFEEREISSLYLWEKAVRESEVNTPWQKLKKSILMFLQIAAVLIMVLALSNPYLFRKSSDDKNIVIVIDNTGSMNTRYENTTRFEAAKASAEELIKNSSSGGNITIITSAIHPKVEITTSNKKEALLKLTSIKASNSRGDIKEVLSLITAISKQQNNTTSLIYTDSPLNMEGVNGKLISMSSECINVSLDYISHSIKGDKLNVMVRVSNRNQESTEREVSLYGDGKLLAISQSKIEGMETKTVFFNDIPRGSTYLSAELTEKDDLMEDNIIYDVVSQSEKKKVLLVSQKNIFLERAFTSINNVELFKSSSAEVKTDGYDLYIFDGILPKTMPVKGSMMIINPPESQAILEVKGSIEGDASKVTKHPLTKYIEAASFNTASIKKTNIPNWAEVLINVGNNPGVMAGNMNGRKICIINFDLHNSEFPLMPEFPIFIYNITGYLVGTGMDGKTSYKCGEGISLEMLPDAEAAWIEMPKGAEEKLELMSPGVPFSNTNERGIYKLLQRTKDKEYKSLFGVNFPSQEESVVNSGITSAMNISKDDASSSFGKSIQFPLILIVLAFMVLEWVVYTRGY